MNFPSLHTKPFLLLMLKTRISSGRSVTRVIKISPRRYIHTTCLQNKTLNNFFIQTIWGEKWNTRVVSSGFWLFYFTWIIVWSKESLLGPSYLLVCWKIMDLSAGKKWSELVHYLGDVYVYLESINCIFLFFEQRIYLEYVNKWAWIAWNISFYGSPMSFLRYSMLYDSNFEAYK